MLNLFQASILWCRLHILLEQHWWLLAVPLVLLPRETKVNLQTCQPCLYLVLTILHLHLPRLLLVAHQVSEMVDTQAHGTKACILHHVSCLDILGHIKFDAPFCNQTSLFLLIACNSVVSAGPYN